MKIFEEDFQRERSDRERMNEEKEELKQQLEKLQKQLVLSNNQVSSAGCHQQHHVPPGVSVVCSSPVSQPPYPSQSGDRRAGAVVLLLLVPATASFTCLFLLPLSWGSDGGGQTSACIPAGHGSIPCPTDTGGSRVGSALTPPPPHCFQLRASKDDCQREKEEKEKLKKLLKQHKQVGMGEKPFLGGGAGVCAPGPRLLLEGQL